MNFGFTGTVGRGLTLGEGAGRGMMVFSGGALKQMALFSLGIMPYITASIIMQLMTKVSPTLEELAKEGPAGQRKISQYTRYLTVPICMVQGFFAIRMLISYQNESDLQLLYSTGMGFQLFGMLSLMAGALFVMWLGEQISERGLGNGASLLIMAGILVAIPHTAQRLIEGILDDTVEPSVVVILAALYVLVVIGIVFVTQAQRRIPIQHAKHFLEQLSLVLGTHQVQHAV